MSSKSGIYQIRNLVNGKVYIGSACRLNSRKSDHLRSLQRGNHVNQKLQRAWNKYGPSAFEFSVLELIGQVAQSGKTMSEATRAKISAAQKLRAPASEETRRKLAEAGKGRVFSDETRAKISAAQAGRKNGPMSEEAKAHRSALMQGKKWTPEQIAKRVATKRAKREAAQA